MGDPGFDEITAAVALLQSGAKADARAQLLDLWARCDPAGPPLHRCTLAHFLADTEEDVAAELEWDLRALEAATGSRDTSDRDALAPDMDGFLPSLHLNVGDAYRRTGDIASAAAHAKIGSARAMSLPSDGYGSMVREGLQRLSARLGRSSGLSR